MKKNGKYETSDGAMTGRSDTIDAAQVSIVTEHKRRWMCNARSMGHCSAVVTFPSYYPIPPKGNEQEARKMKGAYLH